MGANKQTAAILWQSLRYLKPYWQLTLGVYLFMLLINGINIAAHKPDLLDRCILFALETIKEDERRTEKEYNDILALETSSEEESIVLVQATAVNLCPLAAKGLERIRASFLDAAQR